MRQTVSSRTISTKEQKAYELQTLMSMSKRQFGKAADSCIPRRSLWPPIWLLPTRKRSRPRSRSSMATSRLTAGKVKIDVPEIAENGLVVPISDRGREPDERDADLCQGRSYFCRWKPLAGYCHLSFHSGLRQGLCGSTRMRLAQTQNIICVAEMSNGTLHTAKAQVKVTIGGCGG